MYTYLKYNLAWKQEIPSIVEEMYIITDHGPRKVDNINLEDYPDIFSVLERTTSKENRAVSFLIEVSIN